MRRAEDRQRGLTMVEIMVSLVLVAIACAFVFSIQVRMSSALRDQSTVSEVQQTLRSASDLVSRDVRMAGFLAQSVGTGTIPLLGKVQTPVEVVNGGAGPDQITIMYADSSTVAVVATTNSSISFLNPLSLFETTVIDPTGLRATPVTGFAVGDAVLATRGVPLFNGNGDVTFPSGVGCVMGITGIVPPDKIVTNPLFGSIWNLLANLQCTGLLSNLLGAVLDLTPVWNDGKTEFVHMVYRTYRIKPLATDPRGVLQMCEWTKSPSFCDQNIASNWTDLALGIVDMQIALRAQMSANASPCAADADATHDWFSSDNMNDLLTTLPQSSKVVEVSITLLAKSTKEVQGVALDKTPDLWEVNKLCNHIGDVDGTVLPQTSTASPYYGDHVYRTYTQTVELRNGTATN